MGLNKPIKVDGGLTAADVQSIIDAQTTAIAGKVDAQTNTLITDIPSSISGGASISDINAALDEKLPQYAGGAVVKSIQRGVGTATSLVISSVNAGKSILLIDGIVTTTGYKAISSIHTPDGNYVSGIQSKVNGGATLSSLTDDNISISNVQNNYSWQLIEFY